MYNNKWTAAFVLAVLFALPATASNAQSKIGKATSVKPQAEGSMGGTLAPQSDVHANETVRTGSSGVADLRFIDQTNLRFDCSASLMRRRSNYLGTCWGNRG